MIVEELIGRLEELKPKLSQTTYWEVERDLAEGDLEQARYMIELLEARYADDL